MPGGGTLTAPLRVLIDGDAFFRHTRSGITRYFTELVRELRADATLGIDPMTPYRYVANRHLVEALPGAYRRVILPSRARGRFFETANRRALARAVGEADLVHHSLYLPEELEIAPGTRRICTVYDFTFELHPEAFPDPSGIAALVVEKHRFLARCDGLLCISQTTHDDLRTWRPDLDVPVAVTPLGVGQAFFTSASAAPALRGLPARYLLHVGNRHGHKNMSVLFEAFAAMAADDESLHLVLCGQALASEQDELDRLGITARTVRLRVSDEELPSLYAHAAAFVFPSRYEGFGLPVLEAMASGCPVIVAETPALLEVAHDAASTFDPGDADALAAAIERLLGDGSLRDELVAAGRQRAEAYTWHRTAELTAAAYETMAREA
ncbi:MAG TPA: glycosyltransferase family 1 protein [Acidimicrobiales bacterium]|nr:glycosyltransferase family 1 protein [Acidimicrobiales bacterium]